jgi:glutaryl-CoA dehydrogenase
METAEGFSQEYLMPQIQMANRNSTFDRQIYREMGKLGLIGCTLPDYGCPGISSVGYGKFFLLIKNRSDQQSH